MYRVHLKSATYCKLSVGCFDYMIFEWCIVKDWSYDFLLNFIFRVWIYFHGYIISKVRKCVLSLFLWFCRYLSLCSRKFIVALMLSVVVLINCIAWFIYAASFVEVVYFRLFLWIFSLYFWIQSPLCRCLVCWVSCQK